MQVNKQADAQIPAEYRYWYRYRYFILHDCRHPVRSSKKSARQQNSDTKNRHYAYVTIASNQRSCSVRTSNHRTSITGTSFNLIIMSNHNQIPGRNVLRTIHTLFLLLSSFTSRASPPRFNLGYFGLSSTNKTQSTATADAKMWSSFLTVDPAKIMGLLITRGGLVLPKYIQDELISTARVCSVDDAQLNLLERKMLFSNFTVALPGSPRALQVGRFYMTWDSYLKPCVDIELDDVTILVEFTNLMLTRTNW